MARASEQVLLAAAKREAIFNAVLAAARGGHRCPTNAELGTIADLSESTVSTALGRLRDAGRLSIVNAGRYRVIGFPSGEMTGDWIEQEWRQCRNDVARAFGIPPTRLVGRSRRKPVVRARHAAAWVLRVRFGISSILIAQMMGSRDHSTILYSWRSAEITRERDRTYRAMTDALAAGIVPSRPIHVEAPAPPPASIVAPPAFSWCDQCQSRVAPERAVRCGSPWCSLRSKAA